MLTWLLNRCAWQRSDPVSRVLSSSPCGALHKQRYRHLSAARMRVHSHVTPRILEHIAGNWKHRRTFGIFAGWQRIMGNRLTDKEVCYSSYVARACIVGSTGYKMCESGCINVTSCTVKTWDGIPVMWRVLAWSKQWLDVYVPAECKSIFFKIVLVSSCSFLNVEFWSKVPCCDLNVFRGTGRCCAAHAKLRSFNNVGSFVAELRVAGMPQGLLGARRWKHQLTNESRLLSSLCINWL